MIGLLFVSVFTFSACDNDTSNCEEGQVFVDGDCLTACQTNTDCFNAGFGGGFICKQFDEVYGCAYDSENTGVPYSNNEYTCVATTEVCNGRDDDCDGQVDENVKNACGECGDVPTEVCDGTDNNCDGQIDEGLLNACGLCGPVPAEICNGLDDDCNGQIPAVENDQDLDGYRICEGDCNDKVPGIHPEAEEICDGEDNDCDGFVMAGEWDLDNDGWRECEGDCDDTKSDVHPAVTELCNGFDDNCNDEVDEGFDVGVKCNGVGVCGVGVVECLNKFQSICSTMPEASADMSFFELCSDNLDNDCDGSVDEGCECDEGDYFPCGTTDEGQCQYGWRICQHNGTWGECTGAIDPQVETCNGFDDDCDGSVDENFVNLGEPCAVGLGACKGYGVFVCSVTGIEVCNAVPSEPNEEVCDGVDNSCNGFVDVDGIEGLPLQEKCYTGPMEVIGVGVCKSGLATCVDGAYGNCLGQVLPTVEVCDGLDNDCDGAVDEGVLNSCGNCGPNPEEVCNGLDDDCDGQIPAVEADNDLDGYRICDGDCNDFNPTVYLGAEELCDLLDNDCDGQVDNGFPDLLTACSVGVGQCFSFGARVCSPDGLTTVCNAMPNDPSFELCNGLDDDCDGATDEGFFVGAPCDGIGECGAGVLECLIDGTGTICSTNPLASANQSVLEVWDNLDNDCDGEVDEDFACKVNETAFCGTNIGECKMGYKVCQNGSWSTCFDDVPPEIEICDGLDNNCDMQVDEGLLNACGICGEVPTEICDGQDNDCDNLVDEGFINLGEPCDVGLGQCRAVGTFVCSNGAEVCSVTAGQAQMEICDGLDNDCDGLTDEGLGLGVQCQALGICSAQYGELECDLSAPGGVACSTRPGGSEDLSEVENCGDNLDNDCDGNVDSLDSDCECDTGAEIECGVTDLGECHLGLKTCVNGHWTDCFGNKDPSAEVCDGLDNDCDGFVMTGEWDLDHDGQMVCAGDCNDNDPLMHSGLTELCNGKDDDCDGVTDEGFFIGVPCNGLGACGVGVYECANELAYRCSTQPGGSEDMSSDESCLGLVDDDCDGTVNEGCECVPAETRDCGTSNTAPCKKGIQTCSDSGHWGQCLGAIEPKPEECNGLDDDCNGFVPIKEVDFDGDGVMECAGDCNDHDSNINFGAVEVCDHVDNDCDGQTDEGLFVGAPCNGVGACGVGVLECAPLGGTAIVICNTESGASQDQSLPEVCGNNVDDDCNGLVDDGCMCDPGNLVVAVCGPGTENGICKNGLQTCSPDGLSWGDCYGAVFPLDAEICNGLDDNCDNVIPANEADADGDGFRVCEGDCNDLDNQIFPGANEVCNGVDDDCDGVEDEGCEYVQCNLCCGFGLGFPVVWWGGDPAKSWFGEGYCDTWTGTVQQICERGEYPILGYENDGWVDWNCNIGNQWGGWTNAGVLWCVDQDGVAVNYEVVSGQVDPAQPNPEGEVILLNNLCL